MAKVAIVSLVATIVVFACQPRIPTPPTIPGPTQRPPTITAPAGETILPTAMPTATQKPTSRLMVTGTPLSTAATVPTPTATRPLSQTPTAAQAASRVPSAQTPTRQPTATAKPPAATPTIQIQVVAPPAAGPQTPGVILDFETQRTWQRGDQPYGQFERSTEQVHAGSFSGQLRYDFPALPDEFVVFVAKPPIPISGQPNGLAAWVYGNGSGHFLNIWIRDAAGEVRQYTFGQIAHQGWQQMIAWFDNQRGWPNVNVSGPDNGTLDYPVSLYAVVLDAVPHGQASSGVIYLDEVAIPQQLAQAPSPTSPAPEPASSLPAPTSPPPTAGLSSVAGTLTVNPPPTDRPAEAHPDLNLAIRGYASTDAELNLVDYSGAGHPETPQLPGLFADNRTPTISSVYRVYDWDWGCNCKGNLITNWPVTLVGFAVTPGETIHVPGRGVTIGEGYEVLVLYAASERITLKYTREDNVVSGYTIHIEGVCVDSGLLDLYRRMNDAGRERLPALRAGQVMGHACGDEIKVAIRDAGNFMDPRSRKDWWHGH